MPLRNSPVFRAAGMLAMLAVLAVILYESSQARGQPGVLELTTNEAYLGHFAVYAAMTFCAMTAIGRPAPGNLVAVFLLAAGVGLAMEVYQAFEPTRTASLGDVIANTAGAFCGLVVYVTAWVLVEPPVRLPTKL